MWRDDSSVAVADAPEAAARPGVLERVAAGDPDAIEDCIDKYGSLIWSLARQHCRNVSDADDAVQDVYLSVWSSADRFDPTVAKESTFITTIARRRLIDRLRRAGRAPLTESIDADESFREIPSRTSSGPDRIAEETEAAEALDAMPARTRSLLRMSFYEGLSHSEIAEALDLPLGTVKTRIRRGLLRLRDEFERDVPRLERRRRLVAAG